MIDPGDAGWIEVTTLSDCLDRAAAAHSHDALVFPGERTTFPELAELVNHYARGLLTVGVEQGEAVGILLHQGVDYLALLLATTKIGGVAVPINARYKARELAHVVRQSRMRAVFISDVDAHIVDHLALLTEALPGLTASRAGRLALPDAPHLRHVVVFGDADQAYLTSQAVFQEGAGAVPAGQVRKRRLRVRVRDTAVIMYTSGTTAAPKGAMLTHEGLAREGAMVARTRFHLSSSDRVWTALPLYHIGGVAFAFAAWAAGATYYHTGAFDPAAAVAQLQGEHCTIAIPAFETIWLAVLDHPDFDPKAMTDLRIVFNVGVAERLRQMQRRLPDAIQVSGFGSTESSSFLCLGSVSDTLEQRVTTCGKPLPGMQVKVVDPQTGQTCPPEEMGEILYKGWGLFDGYFDDPKQTAEAIDGDGWFHSGDGGRMDAEGRLTFVTRLKDMMKVGGENVAAAEVEGHLLTHPAVMMAQVVGAPDARYTEVPAAFLQLKDGAEVTEQQIIDFCLGAIATFKVPRYVRMVTEWPMSGTKVQKYVLRERLAAELANAGIAKAPKLS